MKHKLVACFLPSIVLGIFLNTACSPEQTPIPERILIPAGEFQTIYVDAYYIDSTEVTNARFAQCVADGACTPPDSSSSDTFSSYYSDPEFGDFPVIYVDWYQAQDYCTWAGGSLPTEVQWDKAALGSEDTRQYPWGDQSPRCKRANFNDCLGGPSKVGSYPNGASPYGVLDMLGNVFEWVSDLYTQTYEGNTFNVVCVRGGSWSSDEIYRPWGSQGYLAPQDFINDEIGFRCVYPP